VAKLRKLYGISLGILLVMGVLWMTGNAGHIPAYGDTTEYLALSKTLKVDQYRTIFYPGFLRLSGIFHGTDVVPSPFWAYLIQIFVGAASSAIYAVALVREFGSLRASPRIKAAAVALAAAIVTTNPLVAHFSLAIMSDSLAASLTVAFIGSLAIACAGGASAGRRGLWLAISTLCLLLMALSRVDKLYLGLLLVAMVAIILYARRHRPGSPKVGSMALCLLAALVGAVAVNHFTQTQNPERPPLDLPSMAFNRVVWPRLSAAYPYLPADAKSLISDEDAKRFDESNNNVYPFLVQLLKGHPENKQVINEITLTTLRKFPLQVVGKTCFDIAKYMVPNVAFPLELVGVLPVSAGSAWTYSRMNQPHRTKTKIWLIVSTAAFFLLQLPLAIVFLRKRVSLRLLGSPVVLLSLTCIVGNALLFGLEAGMDAHIRYALPSFVMLLAIVTVLSLLWLLDRPRHEVVESGIL
jgi:hypothetical protein